MIDNWEKLTEMYSFQYQHAISNEEESIKDNMKLLAVHSKGMLELIPKIRDLSCLKDAELNQSHSALTLRFPDVIMICVHCNLDETYGISIHRYEPDEWEEIRVDAENVVATLQSIIENALQGAE